MTDTITLAQISDVHLAPIAGFQPRYWNLKRCFGYLNWIAGRREEHLRSVADRIAADALAQRPDHIAVTGDLANLGLPAEYETALGWLEELGPPDKVSAIPGNHDIYTGRMRGASCLRTWAPYMSSDAWGAELAGGGAAEGAVTFPFVRRVGQVALIALNSAIETPLFVAAGRLGAAQLAALGPILDAARAEGLVRVVLIHHPPLPGQNAPRRGLADAAGLQGVLAAHGAELVLHGHNHRDMRAWQAWSGGMIPVVGVASASCARAHGRVHLGRYNLFHISGPGQAARIDMITRGLANAGGEIVEIGREALLPASARAL